jgi:peptidoglycan/LPS O-acetylase OafA/YrhL
MLGTLRFVLAILVVMNHLWLPTANKIGAHAVVGFYVISGFLMTRIVSEIYVGRGIQIRYLANRFLRIFPVYWLVGGLTVAGLFAFPAAFRNVHTAIRIPASNYEWFQNLTLIDLIYADLRLVPPAWSLSVEVVFYLLIGTGLSRSRQMTILWWAASVAYTAYLVASDASFGDRYTPPAAASLFFSTGAVIYHLSKIQAPPLRPALWWFLLLLFAAWPILVGALGGDARMLGFYGAFALFVPLFAWTVMSSGHGPNKGIDGLLGDLAYPVFLSHYFSAGVVSLFAGTYLVPLSFGHFVASATVCLVLAIAIDRYLDPAVNRLRNKIRPSSR